MDTKRKIYALPRAGFGHVVNADGRIVDRSEIPDGARYFVTTMNELKRAKVENREPIPLQSEPLTIEDMRRIVLEHDQGYKNRDL
jgi:hypothetical protein